jgi:hypothetical protein
MRKLASGVLLWLLLVVSFAGQTSEWKRYRNTSGNFSVMFPGEVKEGPGMNLGGSDEMHSVVALKSPAVYTISYITMARTLRVTEADFESYKRGVFEKLPKCEPTGGGSASPAIEGYIGHSYRGVFETPNNRINIVVNLYWGKHHAFNVGAMFPVGAVEPSEEIKKFLGSFALIDPAK